MKTTQTLSSSFIRMMIPIFLSETQVLVFHEYLRESGLLVADLERWVLRFAPYLDFYNVFSYASDLKRLLR